MVVMCAAESLVTYQAANSQRDEVATKVNTNDLKWEAPTNDFVKLNWDADVDKIRMKIEIGVIFRDGMGQVLATLSSLRDHIT